MNDKKFRQVLSTYYAPLYLIVSNYNYFDKNDFSIFDRYLNNRRFKQLTDLIEYENISKKM